MAMAAASSRSIGGFDQRHIAKASRTISCEASRANGSNYRWLFCRSQCSRKKQIAALQIVRHDAKNGIPRRAHTPSFRKSRCRPYCGWLRLAGSGRQENLLFPAGTTAHPASSCRGPGRMTARSADPQSRQSGWRRRNGSGRPCTMTGPGCVRGAMRCASALITAA